MPTIAHQRFLATLAFSLALHAVVLFFLDWPGIESPEPGLTPTQIDPVKLHLRQAAPRSQSAEVVVPEAPVPARPAVAEPIVEAPNARTVVPDDIRKDAMPTRRLDLSLPGMPAEDTPSTGRIFDPRLARRLDAQRERSSRYGSRTARRLSDVPGQSTFDGGRWTSYVEMGGRCFRVIEADPLEPLSTEQWFPVNCEQ